jgi:hypothetical protein
VVPVWLLEAVISTYAAFIIAILQPIQSGKINGQYKGFGIGILSRLPHHLTQTGLEHHRAKHTEIVNRMPLPRWIDIIIIGTISFIIFSALTAFLIKPSDVNNWIAFIHKLPTHTHYSLLILSGIIIQRLLHCVGDFTFKKFIKNPPLWVAVFLPIVLLYISDVEHKGVGMNSGFYFSLLPITLGLLFLPFATWIFHRFNSWIMNLNKWTTREKNENNQTLALIDWLYDESPICNSLHDRWGRTQIINRVVSRLNSEKTYNRGECILGDYGSGKSSVISLIEEKLKNLSTQNKDNDWIICRFDSWGRIDNAKQAQELILEKMIESIGEHTSISALNNLPQRYLDALQGNDAWWNTLFSIFNASSLEPESQLGKIDNILSAIDKKLLLVIEDLDRNTDCNKLSLEIVPLLDRLRELKQVKFIITLGYEEHLSSTITRITNFREDLTTHEHEKLDFILKEFREFSLNETAKEDKYIDGVIDRAYWPLVDGRAGAQGTIYYSTSYMRDDIYREAYLAIKHYLSNPRTLKYCLRATHSAWAKIHGEVNFDDLLCLNIIKHTEPQAFDFIIRNIRHLNKKNEHENIGKLFENEIQDGIFKNKNNLIKLINFLFSSLFHPSDKVTLGLSHQSRDIMAVPCIQIIANDKKYFDRIINVESERHDREIINEIINSYIEKRTPSFDTNNVCHITSTIINFRSIVLRDTSVEFTYAVYSQITHMLCVELENQSAALSSLHEILSPKSTYQLFNNNHKESLIKNAIKYLILHNIEDASSLIDITDLHPEIKNDLLEFSYHSLIGAMPNIENSNMKDNVIAICLIIKKILSSSQNHTGDIFDWMSNINNNQLSIHYFYTLHALDEQSLTKFFRIESMTSFIDKCKITESYYNDETRFELSKLEQFIKI